MIASLALAAAIAAAPMVLPPSLSVATHSPFSAAAQDMHGIEPSIYRGKHYRSDRGMERFRRCVLHRESRGNYRADNGGPRGGSTAMGAYQFLDGRWRKSLVWMFIAESKETGDGLAGEARDLRRIPIRQWNRYWQDRAFWTALNAAGDWSGRAHWAGFPKC